MKHELKTWNPFFEEVLNGSKTFELRFNDRNYQVGDLLVLHEFNPDAGGMGMFTGRTCNRTVSYILNENPFIDLKGHVILGLQSTADEEIKQQFCNELGGILSGVRLKNYRTDDGDAFPLVDHLSEISDNTISSGKEEISNIVEQIYFRLDELSIFQSRQSLPKVLPTDEEINKKIFEICSRKRSWDGKSLPITTPGMLNELAQWFKNETRNNEGEPISDAGFFSDN